MAAQDSSNVLQSLTQGKIFSIRNLLLFVTAILMAMIVWLTVGRLLEASSNSTRAEQAMEVNKLIDSISTLKLALADERSLANTAYGFKTEADSFFPTQIKLNRNTIDSAFEDIEARLPDVPDFDNPSGNEGIYGAVETRFGKVKADFFKAHDDYMKMRAQLDADLGQIADSRELRGRDVSKAINDVIENAAQLRSILENNYDFGDDRISKVIQLKHNLWTMIEYATRESAALGGSIVSGSQIRGAMQTLNAQYVGQGKEAWEQVQAIVNSLSVAEEGTEKSEIDARLKKIEDVFFAEFEETRFAIYDASEAAEMDMEGNVIADYGISPADWITLAQDAVGPVSAMSQYAGDLSRSLNEAAVSKADANMFWSTVMLFIVAGIGCLAIWVVMFRVVRPVNALSDTMMVLAQGKLEVEVPSADAQDEVGDMARSVQIFKENAIERQRLEVEQREREERERTRAEEEERRKREEEEAQRARELEREETARQERRQAMLDLADQFEASVMAVVQGVSNSATEMENAARGMAETADDTSKKSEVVANAAQQASSNAQMVASAAEELSASVREITGQTNQSSASARDAVSRTENAGKDVAELVDAAQKIGDVVKLINDIAEQTNLLALNATIEAARAGEAGRGFAVVANEVKALADQTRKATQEIRDPIEALQKSSDVVVESMTRIMSAIDEASETSGSISAAVEEQNAATQEIARAAQSAADATSLASGSVDGALSALEQNVGYAVDLSDAAKLLDKVANDMSGKVDAFLHTVRSSAN